VERRRHFPEDRGSLSSRSGILSGLARLVRKGRYGILVAWVIFAALLGPEARHAASRLESTVRMDASPAASVDRDLAHRFHSPFVHRVFLVVTGIPDPAGADGREALGRIVSAVASVPGVAGTVSYLDSPDPIFRGKSGGTLVIVGLDSGDRPAESLMTPLRATSAALQAELRGRFPQADLGWTGEIPLNIDVRQASSEDLRAAERRALPLALLLLVVAFGSVVAALLPVGVGVLAVLLTLGAAALLARSWHLSIFVQNIASMIGLGLGIDYALLMVSRFRESLAKSPSGGDAVEDSLPAAGRTLLLSAVPVGIGFAALMTIPASDFRSIGAAGMLVTFFTLLIGLTLLPAILAILGRFVDLGKLIRPRGEKSERLWSDRWHRWGRIVVHRPWTALVVGGAPVLLLALQAPRLQTGALRGDWLPSRPESVRALQRLEDMGRGNAIQSLRLLLDLPAGAPVTSAEGWIATRRLTKALQADPRIERVHSLATVAGAGVTKESLRRMSQDARTTLVSEDELCVLFEIVPAMPSTDPLKLRADAEALAREMKVLDAPAVTGLEGTAVRVGGLPAANTEFQDMVSGRFRSVILLVMGVTFLALFVGFRSLLVAAKAVALNLLTVAAAFGALVLVFQEGHGSQLFGLAEPPGRIYTIVPVLAFCIVFGLSMDYEVFLVSRVAEARRTGLSEEEAIVEGLSRTGGVITSAASIMIAVFAAFAMGGFLPIQMLGFTLMVAVLLDATIVRMVIGPALLRLAGRWNWWPGSRIERAASPGRLE
jgi:putative drug exporter of the RND superfamily